MKDQCYMLGGLSRKWFWKFIVLYNKQINQKFITASFSDSQTQFKSKILGKIHVVIIIISQAILLNEWIDEIDISNTPEIKIYHQIIN